MSDNSRSFVASNSDTSRVNPTGLSVNASWTFGALLYQSTTMVDGLVIVRVGPQGGVPDRGFLLLTDAPNQMKMRIASGQIDGLLSP